MRQSGNLVVLFLISLLIVCIGAAFTWFPLSPEVGYDDANITQIYARNLAMGHGYVYNVGGERVEGSTSLVWTGINIVVFALTTRPEAVLSVLSFVLTAATILLSVLMTYDLDSTASRGRGLITAALFLVFPPFFGWAVWSLMDTTLWIFLITAMVFVLVRLEKAPGFADPRLVLPLVVISALLPVTRPEGIALTTAVGGYYLLRGLVLKNGAGWVGIVVGLCGFATAGAATLWRLSYFGYPVPNTFYAKTTTHALEQTIQGAKYALSYLAVPHNGLFAVACCIAGGLVLVRGTAVQRAVLWLVTYLIAGSVVVYMALGGDHFGSHRFFLFFLPIGLPLIVAGIPLASRQARGWPLLVCAVLFAMMGMISAASFLKDQGGMLNDFTIAEDGRALGVKLNSLPGAPVVAVVAAGGIRMSYDGDIQDLMGLNWVAMAHAPDDSHIADYPNHQGFNTDVFWQNPPDIFVPYTGACPRIWQPIGGFLDDVTDYVSASHAFRDKYDLYCYEGMVFYAARDYVDRVAAGGLPAAYHRVERSR